MSTKAHPTTPANGRQDDRAFAWKVLRAMVFLVPLANGVFTMPLNGQTVIHDMYDLPKIIVLEVGVLLALAAWGWQARSGELSLRRSRADYAVLAFLGWIALSAAFSISPAQSLVGEYLRAEGLLTYALYGMLFFLVVQLADSVARIREIAVAVFWSSIPVAVYGLVQSAGFDPVPWEGVSFVGRAFSTYGNPMPLGGFLVFSLPLGLALAVTESSPRVRALRWAGVLLNLSCLMMTFTRGAWIGGAAAVILVALQAWRDRVRLVRAVDVPMAAVAAVALSIVVAVNLSGGRGVTNIAERISGLFDATTGSGASRLDLWQSAIKAIGDRPLVGFGTDTFSLFFPAYRSEQFFRNTEFLATADNAHNHYLQLAATIGIPGMLLFVAIAVVVGIAAWRLLAARADKSGVGRVMYAAFGAAALGYLVNLFFGYSQPGTTFLLWISFAVLVSPGAREMRIKAGPRGIRASSAIAVACIGVMLATLPALAADRRYLEATRLLQGSERLEAAREATVWAPYREAYRYEFLSAQAEAARNPVAAALEAGEPVTEPMRLAYDAAIAELEEAIARSPWYFRYREFLAVVDNYGAVVLGQQYAADAEMVAGDALEIFPNSPTLLYERGRARTVLGSTAEAEADFARALELEPRFADSAAMLARSMATRGAYQEAVRVLDDARTDALDPAPIDAAYAEIESAQESQ